MRKWISLLLALVTAILAAFLLSPWPGVQVIRTIFDQGAAAASAKLDSRVPEAVTTTTLQYDPADADAVLDIYKAPDSADDAVTVVWVHGGGFVSGRRQDIENYLKVLAGQGFTVVNVDYTIAPEAPYPTPVRQLSAALAYLAREGRALGINPDRLVLAGDSAGAQIAAQTAAISANPDYAAKIGVTPGLSAKSLAGTVLFCGVYDISKMGKGGGILGWFVHVTAWAYSGTKDWRDDATFATMNITPFLTPDFPPAFVSAGNADPLGPQSVAFADALQAQGTQVHRLFYPADYAPPLAHEYQFDLDTEAGQRALAEMVSWLRAL